MGRKILRWVSLVLCVIGITGAAVSLVRYRSDPARAMWFGLKPLLVDNSDMEPALQPRDLVLIRRSNLNTVEDGDMLAYVQDGQILLRRAVGRSGDSITVKADQNAISDGYPVNSDNYLGRVLIALPAVVAATILGLLVILLLVLQLLQGASKKKVFLPK